VTHRAGRYGYSWGQEVRHGVEEVELGGLLERVRPRLESRVAQAGMTLAIADLDARVRGDVTAIEQILFNAMDNACKYAAAADDKQIRIDWWPEGGRVVVEVSDGGPGIAPRIAAGSSSPSPAPPVTPPAAPPAWAWAWPCPAAWPGPWAATWSWWGATGAPASG
jgi:hypothetical protein